MFHFFVSQTDRLVNDLDKITENSNQLCPQEFKDLCHKIGHQSKNAAKEARDAIK